MKYNFILYYYFDFNKKNYHKLFYAMMKICYFYKLPVHCRGRANIFVPLWKIRTKTKAQTRMWKQDVWSPQCKEENFSSTVFQCVSCVPVFSSTPALLLSARQQFFVAVTNLPCELGALQYCSSTSLANNRDGCSKWRTDLWATRFLSGRSFGRCGDDETKAGTTALSYSE